jgi:hypothetical protein
VTIVISADEVVVAFGNGWNGTDMSGRPVEKHLWRQFSRTTDAGRESSADG